MFRAGILACIAVHSLGAWGCTDATNCARKPAQEVPPPPPFRFASSHSDDMVLQQAPSEATVWGFVPAGEAVSVHFNGHVISAKTVEWLGESTWIAKLPSTTGSLSTTYTITAMAGSANVSLSRVLFGDVWVCSGQSNMAYPLGQPNCWNSSNLNCTTPDAQCSFGCVNNSGVEIADMANYPHLRLYQNLGGPSPVPVAESFNSGWKLPSDVGGKFSAMCWFFGRDLYSTISAKVPIGLIETNVGGTPDEHWSSPDAIKKCTQSAIGKPWGWANNFTDSVLWNGKVVPLVRNTIRGVVWMQGEANAGRDGRQYNCSFPAMIRDWRVKWAEGSDGASDPEFPFGWAQLNSVGKVVPWVDGETTPINTRGIDDPLGQWMLGFPSIRVAEDNTLSVRNTFQAIILDTPVASGSVHSPYKQPAGSRLARRALAVAYNQPQPNPIVASITKSAGGAITVSITGTGGKAIEVRSKLGFEVLGKDGLWHTVSITSASADSVTLAAVPGASAVRYLFRPSPCTSQPYLCPIYLPVSPLGALSGELGFIPLGPFITTV